MKPGDAQLAEVFAIEVLSLTKRFGDLVAVDHASFEVKKGEFFGFLGPNGAGKTTTIRMLTTLTKPSEGTAKVFGFDVQREALLAKGRMGIVPEISNIYDELSAWDNLLFTAELYHVGKSEAEKRAEELLGIFDLHEKKRGKARSFSKGMRRRLAIAMGLMNKPELLFLDEPTSGLDVQSTLIIKDVVRDINRQGSTIFLTTHNIEEANILCDRVAIIHKGRIAAIDTPERLKRTIQSVQSVEVAFDSAPPDIGEGLERVGGVNEVRKEGDKFRLYTNDPSNVLLNLWDYVKAEGLKPITVNTLGPSLEDVFVRLTR
jgi:ABC-2 type transport system ATP-binding protein